MYTHRPQSVIKLNICCAGSEKQIQAISTRKGSPDWLVVETETIKKGLMKLRHNVVLLRDEAAGSGFFPVTYFPLVAYIQQQQ